MTIIITDEIFWTALNLTLCLYALKKVIDP